VRAGAALGWSGSEGEPDVIALGYLVTTAICLGAVIYLIGTVLGYRLFALRLRWAGWIVMTLGFVVPSTFSLALPIVLLLAVTLRPLTPRLRASSRLPGIGQSLSGGDASRAQVSPVIDVSALLTASSLSLLYRGVLGRLRKGTSSGPRLVIESWSIACPPRLRS
jgi:hypothetical protein